MSTDQALIEHWMKEECQWQEQFQGWDFSKLISNERVVFNMSEEKLGWDYAKVICQTITELASLRNDDQIDHICVLDLGTGGGEFLETLLLQIPKTKKKLKVYATESYQPNYILAQQRLRQYDVMVFLTESASLNSELPFIENELQFDLIISRHTCYNIREVNRLLKSGTGLFITQQVDGTSMMDLIQLFGHEPKWPFFTLSYASSKILQEEAPKMELLSAIEAETKIVFKDIDALIIYLHAVPWLIEDFTVEKYQNILLDLYHREPKELIFTSKYMFLKAMKREEK